MIDLFVFWMENILNVATLSMDVRENNAETIARTLK